MSTETRSLTTDFIQNNVVKQPRFIDEIRTSSITKTLEGVNVIGDDVNCFFDVALSAPEQATLTALANAHLGIYEDEPSTEPVIVTNIEAENIDGIGGTGVDINGIRITSSGLIDGRDLSVDGEALDAHIPATSGVHGVSGNVVGTTDTQTLTNKTLTTPIISQISNTGTLTLPTSTTTLVGRNTSDTLTNKTLTDPSNNITSNSLRSATTTINVSSATAPTADQVLTATSGTNATWQTLTKVFRFGKTWAISGEIKVPSGNTNFLLPFFVSLVTGQTAQLVSARYVINTGTSVTANLQINGVNATGFTGISITTTPSTTDPTNISLSDNDRINLVVTAVSGTPVNMSFTAFIEYTQ